MDRARPKGISAMFTMHPGWQVARLSRRFEAIETLGSGKQGNRYFRPSL